MGHEPQTRRRWIVHARYQFQFAAVLVLMHLSVGFLFMVALWYRVRSLVGEAGSIDAFLAIEPWAVLGPVMLGASLVSAGAIFFVGIRYAHRIVGPLPRIARTLRVLSRGENPPRLTFRRGDVLASLAGEVNLLADSLHPRTDPSEVQIDSPETVAVDENYVRV